jgi:RsiW-degrading membrane proteinase PrsW (M82 family)
MGTSSVSPGADRRLAVIAALSVGLSVVVVIVRTLGVLPSAVATALVLVGVAVALRGLLVFSARAATAGGRERVLTLVSTAGLAVSAVTVCAGLPQVTHAGGTGKFLDDLAAHLWVLGLLAVAVGSVRTFGWRVVVGTGFAGFLAVPTVARFIGTPVVSHFGSSSLFATAVYVPVTEEILKATPIVLVVVFAARRTSARPAALDLALLGAWSGAGFALYEDALYGRGGFDWSADKPFSLLLPTERSGAVGSTSYVAAGHLVYTALLGLGIGVTVLYRHRFRWARAAAPVAALVVVAEHVCANALPLVTATGTEPLVERVLDPLTLGGRLATFLLLVGAVAVTLVERRAVGRSPVPAWFLVRTPEARRRAAALAATQSEGLRRPAPSHHVLRPTGAPQ